MLHVPGMPEGVHVSFSPEDQPVSAPARPDRYTPPGLVEAGTPSEALTALLDAHELAYGHALCSEAYGLPDLAERRQAEEEAFRALLHTPMHSDADRVAYAIAVISRQMHSLGDASATERDHPMAVAYRNLRFGEHAREPEEMRSVGRKAEPSAVDPEALALVDAIEQQWAAEIVGDREDREDFSAEADARSDARMERRYALLKAAEALPARSREARYAKALAFTWDGSIQLWIHEQDRDQYGTDGRLMLDLMDSLTGDASSPASSPAVAAAPIAADPHVALLPALRQAFAWNCAAMPIRNDAPSGSREDEACGAVHDHCWRLAGRIVALPAPKTPAGLGALALALSVAAEGAIGAERGDDLDHQRYGDEKRMAAAIRAMMAAAGVEPLPGWTGFGDEPDHEARTNAAAAAAGSGSLPAWALAGETGPDAEDCIGEGSLEVAPCVQAPAASLPSHDLSGYSIPQLCALFGVYERAEDHFYSAAWWPKLGEAGSSMVTSEGDRCMALKNAVADELQNRAPTDGVDADDRGEMLMRRTLLRGDWDDTAQLVTRLRGEVSALQGAH